MQELLDKLDSLVWNGFLIAALLGTGVIYTVKLGGIQFRLPVLLARNKNRQSSGLSQLKTVCMSLGASMGTGNIAGTAAALAVGGAGSVFWMWVSAFLGMALVYAENTLSTLYSDENVKGPMAYLSKGLGSGAAACFFAACCVLSSFGMGGAAQVNTFAVSLGEYRYVPPLLTAVLVFLVIVLITGGGASRIGTAAQYLLPLATVAYTVVCLWVIGLNAENIPSVFGRIFGEAFGLRQAAGGFSGYALAVGIRRGIFSNEAGLGSSPILHSAASSENCRTQAVWSMFEVFFDTIFCCTLTAVTIMCACDTFSVSDALSGALGEHVGLFLTVVNGLFALCTVIGWYYCGETSFLHLTKKRCRWVYCLLFAAVSASGALFAARAVWTASDIFNGLMAVPNLLGLLLLLNKVKKE